MSSHFTVASAQYDIGFFSDFSAYADKLTTWVSEAARHNARLLVFPEYGSMELASILGADIYQDLHLQIREMQRFHQDFLDLHQQLCRRFDVMMLAASFPVMVADDQFRNRAYLITPDGIAGFQDKLVMTRFETELWSIQAGDEIKVMDTDLGRIAVNICYDVEFPLIANAQVQTGADLILVPSCTDTQAGFYRVRIGAQARALENQCYVVQSPTFGEAAWSQAVDVNTGRASVYTPVDYGFSDNGILTEGVADKPGWVFADIDMAGIAAVREHGQVFNYRDWPRQHALKKPQSTQPT